MAASTHLLFISAQFIKRLFSKSQGSVEIVADRISEKKSKSVKSKDTTRLSQILDVLGY